MARLLFRLTAFAATVFVITILAMVAMLLGDSFSPANLWFNQHGATVLMGEVVTILILGVSAMTADRRETLQRGENSVSGTTTGESASHRSAE